MAVTTPYAFSQFMTAINLPGEHRTLANSRKDWVVGRLSKSLVVLDAHSIGSVPRYTALLGHADLDVLVVLDDEHFAARTPAKVLLDVKTALGSGAGTYRRNGQAVTIKFQSWPNVDVVPARRLFVNGQFSHYEIPDMHNGVWLRTDPARHARELRAAAEERGEGFRQAIKMAKHWNRRQAVPLQSYHIEVIALNTSCDWAEPGWAIYNWFKAARERVSFCWHEQADVSAYLSWNQADTVKASLAGASETAVRAWSLTYGQDQHREAITAWRGLFGFAFPAYG